MWLVKEYSRPVRLVDVDSQLTVQMKGESPLQPGMMTYSWRMGYPISLMIRDHHIDYVRVSQSWVAEQPGSNCEKTHCHLV